MTPPQPDPPSGESAPDGPAEHSYGNMSERHWSKTRGERNREALDYYRGRNDAPGVAEGGEARNSYCMECDGVIPWDGFEGGVCPHCGAEIDGNTRRYFNWVEIDRPPESDRLALAVMLGGALFALALVAAILYMILS